MRRKKYPFLEPIRKNTSVLTCVLTASSFCDDNPVAAFMIALNSRPRKLKQLRRMGQVVSIRLCLLFPELIQLNFLRNFISLRNIP